MEIQWAGEFQVGSPRPRAYEQTWDEMGNQRTNTVARSLLINHRVCACVWRKSFYFSSCLSGESGKGRRGAMTACTVLPRKPGHSTAASQGPSPLKAFLLLAQSHRADWFGGNKYHSTRKATVPASWIFLKAGVSAGMGWKTLCWMPCLGWSPSLSRQEQIQKVVGRLSWSPSQPRLD